MDNHPPQAIDSAISFPCDFLIKVMGKRSPNFKAVVLQIVQTEFPTLNEQIFSERPSKDGTYIALSFTVPASDKAQLDRLYEKLTQAPEVIMAL